MLDFECQNVYNTLKSEMGVKNESTVAFFICLHNCFCRAEFGLPCSAVVLSLRCPGRYSQHIIESICRFYCSALGLSHFSFRNKMSTASFSKSPHQNPKGRSRRVRTAADRGGFVKYPEKRCFSASEQKSQPDKLIRRNRVKTAKLVPFVTT